jgi:hypothetical protein
VLEQVGEPGAARPLVTGSDVIPKVHGHDGGNPVWAYEDLEPVVQRVVDELEGLEL